MTARYRLFSLFVMGTAAIAAPPLPAASRALESYARVARGFEKNEGQSDPQVRFTFRASQYAFFLTQEEAVLAFADSRESPVRIRLGGATRPATIRGEGPLAAKSSYFRGNSPSHWHTGVENYRTVRYGGIYPGIDMQYREAQGLLECDFIVRPRANPGDIRLRFAGIRSLSLSADGDLLLQTAGGLVRQGKPVAFQELHGVPVPVASRYAISGRNEVRFVIGDYHKYATLVIDPTLSYSSYLGGSANSAAMGVALDGAGNAYIAGLTAAIDFPVKGGLQAGLKSNTDIFVAKIDPTGSTLLYSTLVGGSGRDVASGIAVDKKGQAYIAGTSWSTDFPLRNAFQNNSAGAGDAVVAALSSDGSALVYSTYLGGAGADTAYALSVDGQGDATIAGASESADFPTANAIQPAFGGGAEDGFIAQFNPAGALIFSTYLGGSAGDECRGVALDPSGNIYATGATWSPDFPTRGAVQPQFAGGEYSDAFVVKLSPGGAGLVYSTYLGGSEQDFGNSIAADVQGDASIAGETSSTDFPVAGGPQSALGGAGSEDAFLAKFSPDGSALLYSTYLGGSDNDFATGIALDPAGNMIVTGGTSSKDFPVLASLVGPDAGLGDAFAAGLPSSGAPVFSTLLGGSSSDVGNAVAVDNSGNVLVAGLTDSTDFPVFAGVQGASQGEGDAFFLKLQSPASTATWASVSAASFLPSLAPNSIAAGFGSNLSSKTQVATSLPLPLSLGGVTVQVTDSKSEHFQAPLFAVTPGQVNYLVPKGILPGFVTVTLTRADGTTLTSTTNITAVAPALFAANENGSGVAAAIAVVVQGGTQTSFPVFSSGAPGSRTAVPIDLGSSDASVYLELYGSGISGRASLSDVQVSLGGQNVAPLYAGPSQFAGLDQVNISVPRSLRGSGDVAIAVSIAGLSSNAVTVNIR